MSISERREQGRRLQRALMALALACALVSVLALADRADLLWMPRSAMILLLIAWLVGQGALVALMATGRNQQLRDPNVTLFQILWLSVVPIVVYPMAPELTGVVPLWLLTLCALGARFAGPEDQRRIAWALGGGFLLAVGARLLLGDVPHPVVLALELLGVGVGIWLVTLSGLRQVATDRLLASRESEVQELERQLREQASKDELTGAITRHQLMDVLHGLASLARRNADHGFSLAMIDLDRFKRINDHFGHDVGDALLRRFARWSYQTIRDSDHLARYDGEEFVILLLGASQKDSVMVLDRLRQRVADEVISREVPEFRQTVSIGVAQHRPGESPEDTIGRAELALRQARLGGRNRVVAATEDDVHASGA